MVQAVVFDLAAAVMLTKIDHPQPRYVQVFGASAKRYSELGEEKRPSGLPVAVSTA